MSSQPQGRRTDRRPFVGWRLALALLAGALSLQTITADGAWWDLARGRQVLRGAWAPAAALCAGDGRGEADWLGGVPWFVSFAVGGPAGLMVARLAGVSVVVMCCLRGRHAPRDEVRRAATAAAALVACAPGLDPIGSWWDVVCGWLLVAGSPQGDDVTPPGRRSEPRRRRGWWLDRRVLGCLAVAVAWANLGPRSLLALTVVGGRRHLLPLIMAALCLTPRGPLGLLDSLWTLVPPLGLWLQEGGRPAWLAGHAFAGPGPVPIQFVAWLMLAALSGGGAGRWQPRSGETTGTGRPGGQKGARVDGLQTTHPAAVDVGQRLLTDGTRPSMVHVAAWLTLHGLLVANPSSLPALVPLAWWLAAGAPGPPAAARAPGAPVKGTAAPCDHEARWPARLVTVVIALVAAVSATGPWPGVPWRLGWGLAPRLEYRQLLEPLAACGPDGTAFAFDDRAAGMLAWTLPEGPRPWLVPHRALLGGRFVAEATRAAELRAGWDMRQRDREGDWGGWWVPLMARGTRLIVVPDADLETIRRLETGVFKPLVIDAPVVPYAVAGDPQLSPAILRALTDRALVENGAWTFSTPRSIQTDWSTDLWGVAASRPDPRSLVARVDVFLAMRQPRAALKIALPLRRSGLADCTGRIADATMQIAEAERLALGAASPLRVAVLAGLGAAPAAPSALARSLAAAGRSDAATAAGGREEDIMSVASAYLAAGAVAGLERMAAAGIDDPWTRAMLELEAGRPAAARAVLGPLAAGADPRLAGAARDLLAELPAGEPER